jgi:type II secretion system protein N
VANLHLDPKAAWSWLRGRVDRRRLKLWAGYTAYAVALAAVLLYYQFPTEKLKERLQAEFDARVPAHLAIERAKVVFGPALRLDGVAVQGVGAASGRTWVEADRVVLKPSWRMLLGGAPDVTYEMSVGGGVARGRLQAPSGEQKDFRVTSEIKGVEVKRGTIFKALSGLEVSGTMAGKVDVALGESLRASRGKLDLELASGRLSGIDTDALDFESTRFRQFKLACELGKGKLTLRQADLSGGEMSNKLAGAVELAPRAMESRLNLKGSLSLAQFAASKDGKKAPLTYTISGTAEKPKFGLDMAGASQDEGDGNGSDEGDSGDDEG